MCSFPGQRNDKYPDKTKQRMRAIIVIQSSSRDWLRSRQCIAGEDTGQRKASFVLWSDLDRSGKPVYGDGLVDGRRWDRRRNEKGMIVWGHEHRASRWSLLKLAVWCVLWCLICWCWSIWMGGSCCDILVIALLRYLRVQPRPVHFLIKYCGVPRGHKLPVYHVDINLLETTIIKNLRNIILVIMRFIFI